MEDSKHTPTLHIGLFALASSVACLAVADTAAQHITAVMVTLCLLVMLLKKPEDSRLARGSFMRSESGDFDRHLTPGKRRKMPSSNRGGL